MNIKPLSDRIIIEPIVEENKTARGIILPGAPKDKPTKGKVLKVGPGRVNSEGVVCPVNVPEGAIIVYAKTAGTKIEHHGQDYLLIRETDVLYQIEQ